MECSVPTTVSIASWAKGFILRLVLKPTNFSFCWRFFLDKRAPQHIRKKNKMWCNTAEFRTSWEQKFYLLLGGTCISWSILDLRLPFSTIHLKVFDSIKFRNNSQNKFWVCFFFPYNRYSHFHSPRVCLIVHMSIKEGQTMMTYNHLENRGEKNLNPFLTFQGPLL